MSLSGQRANQDAKCRPVGHLDTAPADFAEQWQGDCLHPRDLRHIDSEELVSLGPKSNVVSRLPVFFLLFLAARLRLRSGGNDFLVGSTLSVNCFSRLSIS
jgi:hypothetical protein